MSMDEFHCETLELVFRVTLEDFNNDLFFNEIATEGKEIDKEQKTFSWSYGGREKPSKQHAHILVNFREKHVRIELSYHKSDREIEDIRPPYVEDCAPWLGQFINHDVALADINAFYVFGEGYAPAINLPFPLVSPVDALSGAVVTGVTVDFPKPSALQSAFIQRTEQSTFISAFTQAEINLKEFVLDAELRRLSDLVTPLVRTTEK